MSNVVALRKPAPPDLGESSSAEREIYLRIFEHSKDSVFLVAPGGRILFANPKAVEDTSYEAPELEGLGFKDLFLPEEQPAIATLLETTLQWNTGVDPQRALRRKTGRKIIVEMSSSVVVFEGQKTIFCNVRDITARIKAEEKIKQYSKELETINAELEDRVKARTADLATANEKLGETNALITRQKKELDDVMGNIKQAIFTVSPALEVNPEHSAFVAEVFGAKQAAHADIGKFLYEAREQDSKGQGLRDSLKLVFEQPDTWELARDLMPRDVKYLRPRSGLPSDLRDLKLEWVPVTIGGAIAKVMVVCLDITEQKRLEAEIAQKEAQHHEQLELLSQLISLPASIVAQFVADTRRLLAESKELIASGLAPDSRGLAGGVADPESLRGLLTALMRAMHTLKGSARQFKLESIQRRAHELEARIVPVMDGKQAVDAGAFFQDVAGDFAPLEAALSDVHAFYDKTVGGKGGSQPGETGECLSVPVRKLETLLAAVPIGAPDVSTESVREALAGIVRVPARGLFERLEQAALSLAEELRRELRVERAGDDVPIDFRLVGPLHDAFIHAVRNSVDHAAEPPEEREAAGKPRAMTIKLSATIAHESLVLEISDDGRGVDIERVRARALERGLADAETLKRCPPAQLLQYVFLPGFSTKDVATEISGRGVGLDVVRSVAERSCGGEATMYSEPGRGSRLLTRLPARALARVGDVAHSLVPGRGPDRAALEKYANVSIRELQAPSGGTREDIEGSGVLTDAAGLAKLALVPGVPARRIVCVDSLEPKEMVDEVFHARGARHFIDTSNPAWAPYLRASLRKISGGPLGGLENYLWPGTPSRSRTLTDFDAKTAAVAEVTEFFGALRAFSGFPELMGTIADEMIMNGMFDAPRDASGKEKYNHLPRTHRLVLPPEEAVTIRYGADPSVAGISIEDPFGALSYSTLVGYLRRCYARGQGRDQDQISHKPGGAGLGLFMIFDAAHCLAIDVRPGKRTEIIALISLSRSFERYQRTRKSLSYFEE